MSSSARSNRHRPKPRRDIEQHLVIPARGDHGQADRTSVQCADEKSDALPDRPKVVVVQFVVESNGRADTSAIKVLYAKGERSSGPVRNELAALLVSVRFALAMVGGEAVHQLAVWRIQKSKN